MRKLEDLLERAIGEPDVVLTVYAKPMWLDETVLAPGEEQFAGRTVEAEYGGGCDCVCFVSSPGIFGTMKDEDVVVRIHSNGRNLAEYEAVGKLRPAVDDGVRFA